MEFKFDQEKLEKQIVEQAVDRIYGDDDSIYESVRRQVDAKVNDALSKGLDKAIEEAINQIMERALNTEIHPVNIWGEREGKPTTIRAALHERAKNFWNEKVDNKGKKSTCGGRPRYEHVLGDITAKEFDTQIKQNIVNIAGAIKDSVRSDFYKQVDEKLNEFFKVNSKDDQARKS